MTICICDVVGGGGSFLPNARHKHIPAQSITPLTCFPLRFVSQLVTLRNGHTTLVIMTPTFTYSSCLSLHIFLNSRILVLAHALAVRTVAAKIQSLTELPCMNWNVTINTGNSKKHMKEISSSSPANSRQLGSRDLRAKRKQSITQLMPTYLPIHIQDYDGVFWNSQNVICGLPAVCCFRNLQRPYSFSVTPRYTLNIHHQLCCTVEFCMHQMFHC